MQVLTDESKCFFLVTLDLSYWLSLKPTLCLHAWFALEVEAEDVYVRLSFFPVEFCSFIIIIIIILPVEVCILRQKKYWSVVCFWNSYLIMTNQTTYELVRRRRIPYMRSVFFLPLSNSFSPDASFFQLIIKTHSCLSLHEFNLCFWCPFLIS